ncbi:palladin-like isoform X4 [Styela clava]|uniref:palladin-like isoform X4 n=1 Tax=Styela clava TaxID=7725 RepID=UPI0019397267|nr:palladin-like isoform X4 [Styela clava]
MSASAPKFYKELKDITVSEGECTVLECRLKANPPAQVTWMREGDLIEDSPDFRILHRGEISTLVIGSAYPEDSGEFECVATNSAGSSSTACKLQVTGGGYYSVSTKAPSASKVVTERQLRAPAAAAQSQDALMDSNHNFKQEKDTLVQDLSQKLSSTDISRKGDDQEYRVSNFEQRLINEIEYRLERTPPVNEDPQDAVFESVPPHEQRAPAYKNIIGSYKILVGAPMKFMCKVAGNPMPKVYWFKDGKQISKRSQHYLQSKDEDGVFSLYIPRTCVEDDGNYTALALNPRGRVSCTGRLAILSSRTPSASQPLPERSPMRIQEKGTLADDEESPVEKYFKPVFVQKSGNIEVDEGKLARLDIKVTGLPQPDLTWLINGNPVIQDPHHKILVRENNVHSLLIQPVSTMDEGQYSVVATNKAGRATVHIQLRVKQQEQMTVPIFVQRLTPQVAAEGGSVRLEARVIGKPLPTICWKRGSQQVMNTPRTQIYQDDSGYVCLQISEATRQDSEWYTCSATNKAGIVSCNCKLDVYSPTMEAPHQRRRIRTPHRYANLAKTAGIDMREAISPDVHALSPAHHLPESDDL